MTIHDDTVPPGSEALSEALRFSEEILRNVELNEVPLGNIALKCSRLARLLNEFGPQRMMQFEASGYPNDATGIMTQENWELAVEAGRKYRDEGGNDKVYVESIATIEGQLKADEHTLKAATEAASTAKSPEPRTGYHVGFQLDDKMVEGYRAQQSRRAVWQNTERLASRRNLLYQYALRHYCELRFSGIASDVFSRVRERVDARIGTVIPDAVQRFTAAYDNLRSENPEDWSNAVHSCRRILQDLADAVFPATDEDRQVQDEGGMKKVKLGKGHYINRIIAFLGDRSSSARFEQIVGSHLRFVGDRLDAVFSAAQKGSHQTILRREEADRFVVYTYLIVGDVLSLL